MAERTIEIIEAHNPEELKIQEVFDLLLAQQPQIKNLKVAYGPHPITQQLIPLRKKRLMYAAAIVYKMNMIVREDVYPNDSEVIKTRLKINSYLLRFGSSKNEEIVSEKLTQFFREIENDEGFKLALDTYGLTNDVDNL